MERGRALAERVVARIRERGLGGAAGPCFAHLDREEVRPLPPAVIEGLAFPCGSPLPPSLRAFLAFDASWLGLDPRATVCAGTIFRPLSFRAALAEALASVSLQLHREEVGAWNNDPVLSLVGAATAVGDRFVAAMPFALPGQCYRLPGLGTSRALLYVGLADEAGEYPVLGVHARGGASVDILSPGLDCYLADLFGVPGPTRDVHEMRRLLRWHHEKNLHGAAFLVDGDAFFEDGVKGRDGGASSVASDDDLPF